MNKDKLIALIPLAPAVLTWTAVVFAAQANIEDSGGMLVVGLICAPVLTFVGLASAVETWRENDPR